MHSRTYALACQCYPPIFKDLADDQSPTGWMPVLEVECRRRGRRCLDHTFDRADVIDIEAVQPSTGSAA